jgi:hypothetical protein
MARVYVKNVKIKLDRAALNAIRQRSKTQLQMWARDVLNRRVTPVTPIATGALRRSADVGVQIVGGNPTITWYWTADYAGRVEDMRKFGKSPRMAGTQAPFAEPTLREAIEQEIHSPLAKAFGGKG